jgi:hypothetical protein
MARHSKPHNKPESLREQLVELLENFSEKLKLEDLRVKVCSLVPAFHYLRDLGASLIPQSDAANARDRIISYLRKYPKKVIDGDELMVVSGIGEWARRVRELRVECGWRISSGVLFKEIAEDEPEVIENFKIELGIDPLKIKTDQYVLMNVTQDREAAHRWHMLNQIRKNKASVRDKILEYLRQNVGMEIPGDELRYLAKDAKEWARRTRELRTEYGWPVKTKNSGRPDLAVGVYVLEDDRQAPQHDRAIPDLVRVAVLQRDQFKCTNCGWHRGLWNHDDPRKMLELHHLKQHKDRGENTVENLVTLCNVCHDEIHRE